MSATRVPSQPARFDIRDQAEDPAGPALRLPAADQAPPSDVRTAPAKGGSQAERDLFIDSMRALALLRVFLFHMFGFLWLPLLFPSMSIMFAMAGSLMAASLDRRPGGHWGVLRNRLRRLLPPLWLLGAVLVPVMLFAGWSGGWPAPGSPLEWDTLLAWILPLKTPPGSELGADWVLPLWYVRTYLWFMLLSPPLLWLFRRWPVRVMAVPVGIVAMFGLNIIALDSDMTYGLRAFGVYLVSWLVGFAHHDGLLAKVRGRTVLALAAGFLATSQLLMWHNTRDGSAWDLDLWPVAALLHGVAFVIVVLRFAPSMRWAARAPGYRWVIAAVNARAMTIYLWGNVAIWLADSALAALGPDAGQWESGWRHGLLVFGTASVILIGIVLATGWAEDLAARRPPRIIPRVSRVRERSPLEPSAELAASGSSRQAMVAMPRPSGSGA